MRRVVITGMGIVSSIGNNTQEVLASLHEAKSGITRAEKHAEIGFRSQVHRASRVLHDAGGRLRFTETEQELARDLVEFERLHRARWNRRGGTRA